VILAMLSLQWIIFPSITAAMPRDSVAVIAILLKKRFCFIGASV
jgi:hypothetical protein